MHVGRRQYLVGKKPFHLSMLLVKSDIGLAGQLQRVRIYDIVGAVPRLLKSVVVIEVFENTQVRSAR